MIPEKHHVRAAFIPLPGMKGRLHLEGKDVGSIVVGGNDSAWTYGQFTPAEGFAAFASLFGRWSLIMHEDEDRPLHPSAQEVLNDAERRMDSLHAKIYFLEQDVWQRVRQISIDGNDVEWR